MDLINKRKILIVGGAGYIGGPTVDLLISQGHQVVVFDNLLYEEKYFKPVPFIFGDIRDTEKLVELSKDFDDVIWLAALVGDPACEVDHIKTYQINQKSIEDFCEKSKESLRIIFISTCSVYGVSSEFLDENSPTNPISTYARTKLLAEKCVLDRNGVVFRLGTVYGASDSYSRPRLDLVVNIMAIRACLEGKIQVNGGNQFRPIIAVRDVSQYISRCIDTFVPGMYILSNTNITINDLALNLANLFQVEIETKDLPAEDIRNYRVNSSKAVSTFNYKPSPNLEEEASIIYNYVREKRIKNPFSSLYHNGNFLREQLQ